MFRSISPITPFLRAFSVAILAAAAAAELPLTDHPYIQQRHVAYGAESGLPGAHIARIQIDAGGAVRAMDESGAIYLLGGDRWGIDEDAPSFGPGIAPLPAGDGLQDLGVDISRIRGVARRGDEIAVAAEAGLFRFDGASWAHVLPRQGDTRWAPVDVRDVTYDAEGRLWFAAPQGVGFRIAEGDWRLFTGADGLPYNDFTRIAAGASGVWFGTANGAIQYRDGQWRFRHGGRWLVDNHVNDVAIDQEGNAWFATARGVSCIRQEPMTLAEKAAFYEDEIEKYHRRTEFGYVNPATLATPGDKSTATPRYSDNDGFNTGLYLGAVSFAWAAEKEEKYRQYAHNAFRALAFLSEVTQGGPYGGPEGLIARNVVPITDPDPNEIYDRDYDIRRNQRDALWKILERRVPTDKTGQWYWKCDASSDELDGHFFGYAIYYDRVCESEAEKEAVRAVVRRIMDHVLIHDYNIVDYDGKPTRWGHFSPDDLNRNPHWHAERGLNSYSILTYLAIAHHITGDPKYREEYRKLAFDHGYGMNGMTQPRMLPGPNYPGHQPDDNMAFMNYYHLIRYETDLTLLSMYQYAIRIHWEYEQLEKNAFTNFIYGACARGQFRTDQWRTTDLSPPPACYTDAVDTLQRYPLDLVEWPISNAHRTDMVPFVSHGGDEPTIGGGIDGYAFPIDERQENYWDWDPWKLAAGGDGTNLRPGFHYLLAYYMGKYHGFIEDGGQ
ncbi:MAG: hypothetical protein KF886_25070 [Candidatus Hydrogenedentes bacterium]|nr:hypothetical protein [Candidatus Hydrogenedentota bacterium]